MESDRFKLVGQRLDGKYDVAEAVAEGGFSVVYRAEHCALHRPAAIKVLKVPSNLAEAARRRVMEEFLLEACTLARLDHPALARVLDYGVSPMPDGADAPWMALEWIAGRTLARELSSRRGAGGRSPAEVIELMRPVLDALQHAHELGIVHRDIKPSNLMVIDATTSRRGAAPVRLIDFGIAKIMAPDEGATTGETLTRTATQAFSLHYAAPEQISGTRTGPWTDVHGLALVLTEMLTDAAPYVGRDPLQVHLQVLSAERPTPAKFGVDVGAWEPVIARAAALMPPDRYAHASALLAALEAEVPSRASVTPVVAQPTASQPPRGVEVAVERAPHSARRRASNLVTFAAIASALAVGATLFATARSRSSPDLTPAPAPAPREPRPVERATAPPPAPPPAPTIAPAPAPAPVPTRAVIRATQAPPSTRGGTAVTSVARAARVTTRRPAPVPPFTAPASTTAAARGIPEPAPVE